MSFKSFKKINLFIYFIVFILLFYMLSKISSSPPISAIAVFLPQISPITGSITFTESSTKSYTTIEGTISGLRPNHSHGFHIHEAGDLSDGCTSACAHYNPHGASHGGPADTRRNRHVGDLGNLVTDSKGVARFSVRDKYVKLRGKYSVIGRSLVIHEDTDDLGTGEYPDSKTTGHSGKRLACAVIGYRACDKKVAKK
jgi:Cu-Zn family superoxide dismutase